MADPDSNFDVLVVDDNPDVLKLLARELGSAGLQVRCVDSGEQALAQIEADRPEAVLLDVKMGGIDGFETCSRIRRRHEDLPVVFMTGLAQPEQVLRGFSVGANDFVTKPVSMPEVIARLAAHTRTARLVRATRKAANASERALVAVSEDRLLWANRAMGRLLERCGFDGVPAADTRIPAALQPLGLLAAGVPQLALALGAMRVLASRVNDDSAAVCVVSLRLAAPHEQASDPLGIDAAAPLSQPAMRPDAPRLTARESEVLLWVARGKTNRDIADILAMSPRTVNKHLEHVFEKLGVETRTAAAAAAQRLQLDLQ